MLDTLTAQLRAALGGDGALIGDPGRAAPRFELFHGANSICSQKVRAVLAQQATPYVSHAMNIFAGQTYLPAHVRLRMIGCGRIGLPLMNTHPGSTSATSGGCDPAVVPTLVDRETHEVIVDSKRICIYLDDLQPPDARLRPPAMAAVIDAELDIVDNLPNYQMLAGPPPGEDARPGKLRGGNGVDFATSKVQRCDRYLAEFADDPTLVAAYEAKRAKEREGGENLFSPDAMRVAYGKAEAACAALEARLARAGTPWLFGATLTMADLFWSVELLRMGNLGAGRIWEDGRLPSVAAFASAAEALPCLRSAVIDWPGSLY